MKRTLTWRGPVVLAVALTFVLAACGGDDEEGADEATASEAVEETTTSETVEETTTSETVEETTTSETVEETTTSETVEEGESGIGVTLTDEFEILLASDPVAGSVTFNVSNEGPDFPHALTIVRAASIDELPRKEANGAVDTDALDPSDIIGATSDTIASGTGEDLTVDLEAGDYVFFCQVQNESRSHAAAGQIISVSVGG